MVGTLWAANLPNILHLSLRDSPARIGNAAASPEQELSLLPHTQHNPSACSENYTQPAMTWFVCHADSPYLAAFSYIHSPCPSLCGFLGQLIPARHGLLFQNLPSQPIIYILPSPHPRLMYSWDFCNSEGGEPSEHELQAENALPYLVRTSTQLGDRTNISPAAQRAFHTALARQA